MYLFIKQLAWNEQLQPGKSQIKQYPIVIKQYLQVNNFLDSNFSFSLSLIKILEYLLIIDNYLSNLISGIVLTHIIWACILFPTNFNIPLLLKQNIQWGYVLCILFYSHLSQMNPNFKILYNVGAP